jgi:hypothetical protein
MNSYFSLELPAKGQDQEDGDGWEWREGPCALLWASREYFSQQLSMHTEPCWEAMFLRNILQSHPVGR